MDLKEAQHRREKLIARHPWELARLEVVCELVERQLELINQSGGIILDMGCGDSWFIEKMAERYPNIRYFGVDINFTENDLAFINNNTVERIKVYRSFGEAQDAIDDEQINLVLLLDVIEHISDDIGFLRWLRGFPSITEDTNFMITVPAYQVLFSKHDVFLEHYRRYDNSMLIRHISQAGFKHTHHGYFFFSLFIFRIASVILEKIRSNNAETTGLVEWRGGGTLSSIFKTVLIVDFYISNVLSKLRLKLPGLSNYILCKKSV